MLLEKPGSLVELDGRNLEKWEVYCMQQQCVPRSSGKQENEEDCLKCGKKQRQHDGKGRGVTTKE